MPQPHSGAIIQSGIWAKRTIGVEADLALEIVLEPRELLGAERAEAVLLQIDDIDERDEMHAAVVEGIPAAAGRALAEAFEIGVAGLRIEDVVLARRVMNVELGPRRSSAARRRTAAACAVWVMSPVWIMKAGLPGIARILSIAASSVARASGLAGFEKPIWLSEIWTKEKPPPPLSPSR